MAVSCPLLDGAGRYERTVTAWVDAGHDGLLRLSARLADHRAVVEVRLDVTPSPAFDVVRAEGTARAATAGAPMERCDGLGALAGARIVSGFRRQVARALGEAPWAPLVVDAAVEAARLSRQVTRLDLREVPPGPTPAEFRRLDLTAWPELADSCFTYSAASAPLFESNEVLVPATVDMYAPRPGARLVFHRYKRTEVLRTGDVLALYQSMFDQVHGFELWYEVETETHAVRRARALTPRLPYLGVCDRPQARHRELIGLRLDAGWPAALRAAAGGPGGCLQLTDLTAELFRLLSFE